VIASRRAEEQSGPTSRGRGERAQCGRGAASPRLIEEGRARISPGRPYWGAGGRGGRARAGGARPPFQSSNQASPPANHQANKERDDALLGLILEVIRTAPLRRIMASIEAAVKSKPSQGN
jgi:hypothetical protein